MSEQSKPKPLSNIITDMKCSVIERCRDRLEAAQKKCKEITESKEETGITSRLKRDRGL